MTITRDQARICAAKLRREAAYYERRALESRERAPKRGDAYREQSVAYNAGAALFERAAGPDLLKELPHE